MRSSLSFVLSILGVLATTACRAEPNLPLTRAVETAAIISHSLGMGCCIR